MTRNISDETLTAYVLGELEDAERASVETLLETDAELRRAVAELREAARLSSEALATEQAQTPQLTDEQRRKVVEAARASASGSPAESAAALKIVCDGCSAKYSIAAEKVRGKTFKVRCKKCGESIIVRGSAQREEAPVAEPAPEKTPAPAPDSATAAQAPSTAEAQSIWHIVVAGEQQGPYTADELAEYLTAGSIDHETFAWREGLENWHPMRDIEELLAAMGASEAKPDEAAGAASAEAAAPSPFDEPRAEAEAGGDVFDQPAGGGGLFDQEPAAPAKGGGIFDQEPAAPAGGGGLFDAPTGDAAGPGDVFSSGDSAGGGIFDSPAEETAGGLFSAADTGDLFSSTGEGDAEGGIFASTDAQAGPPVSAEQAAMTGQRNENSVLFSLSNLQALATDGVGVGGDGGMQDIMGGPSTVGEAASGLIDIRSMAGSISTDGDTGSIDELMAIGGGGFAPSLGAPVLAPAAREGMGLGAKIGIIAGGVAAAAAAVVVVVVLTQGQDEPQKSVADEQIAALMAEIKSLKEGGGSAEQMAAAQKALEQAQGAQAGEEGPAAGDEEGGGEAKGGAAKAGGDKGKKGGSKGGSKGGGGKGGSKGGGGKGGAKGGDDPMGGGGKTGGKTGGKKGGSDELDDLLGGATKKPPKQPKTDPKPAGGGGSKGGGGGGSMPESLARPQVQAGMNAVAGAVRSCGHGMGGTIKMSVTIAGTGRVKSASAMGAHAGTPVGLCAARAVRRAKFPKFNKSSLTVKYPFKL